MPRADEKGMPLILMKLKWFNLTGRCRHAESAYKLTAADQLLCIRPGLACSFGDDKLQKCAFVLFAGELDSPRPDS
jgi:hypothetical protein